MLLNRGKISCVELLHFWNNRCTTKVTLTLRFQLNMVTVKESMQNPEIIFWHNTRVPDWTACVLNVQKYCLNLFIRSFHNFLFLLIRIRVVVDFFFRLIAEKKRKKETQSVWQHMTHDMSYINDYRYILCWLKLINMWVKMHKASEWLTVKGWDCDFDMQQWQVDRAERPKREEERHHS